MDDDGFALVLHESARKGRADVMQYLVEEHGTTASCIGEALRQACEGHRICTLRSKLKQLHDCNSKGETDMLHERIAEAVDDYSTTVRYCLQGGCGGARSSDVCEALVAAGRFGHPELIELLLSQRPVAAVLGATRALVAASRHGHVSTISTLLRLAGADCDASEALCTAAAAAQLESLRCILAEATGVLDKNRAILAACEQEGLLKESEECVEVLRRAGADAAYLETIVQLRDDRAAAVRLQERKKARAVLRAEQDAMRKEELHGIALQCAEKRAHERAEAEVEQQKLAARQHRIRKARERRLGESTVSIPNMVKVQRERDTARNVKLARAARELWEQRQKLGVQENLQNTLLEMENAQAKRRAQATAKMQDAGVVPRPHEVYAFAADITRGGDSGFPGDSTDQNHIYCSVLRSRRAALLSGARATLEQQPALFFNQGAPSVRYGKFHGVDDGPEQFAKASTQLPVFQPKFSSSQALRHHCRQRHKTTQNMATATATTTLKTDST